MALYKLDYYIIITTSAQRSFRKTRTKGTPASQAEIDVWV